MCVRAYRTLGLPPTHTFAAEFVCNRGGGAHTVNVFESPPQHRAFHSTLLVSDKAHALLVRAGVGCSSGLN